MPTKPLVAPSWRGAGIVVIAVAIAVVAVIGATVHDRQTQTSFDTWAARLQCEMSGLHKLHGLRAQDRQAVPSASQHADQESPHVCSGSHERDSGGDIEVTHGRRPIRTAYKLVTHGKV